MIANMMRSRGRRFLNRSVKRVAMYCIAKGFPKIILSIEIRLVVTEISSVESKIINSSRHLASLAISLRRKHDIMK